MIGAAFLHPALLWGVLLAAVPVVIHILNRRRYRRRPWAAMEFLLAALKRTRRRIWLEELLLLLLRVGAVVLLALLVARPLSSGAGVLAALAGDRGMHHLIVLDDSASMSQAAGGRSLFQDARQAALDLVAGLAERRRGDLVSVALSSRPDRPLLEGRPLSAALRSALEAELEQREPTGLRLESERLLERLAGALPELAGPEERSVAFYLVSDFRKADWVGEDGQPLPGLPPALAAFAARGPGTTLVSVPGQETQGLGVTELVLTSALRAAGVPLEVTATFRNQGTEHAASRRPMLEAGGGARPLPALPGLAPGEEARLSFPVLLPAAGFHGLTVRLPPDDLAADDTRHLAVEVLRAARVLVAASEGQEGAEGPGFFLAAGLAPGEVASGFEPDLCAPVEAANRNLDAYEAVLLAGAAAPSAELAGRLRRFVDEGGGLLLFTGPEAVPLAWNQALAGLLPFPLGEPVLEDAEPPALFLADPGHPVAARAPEFFASWLGLTAPRGRHRAGGPLASEARVLARLGGADGEPVIATRPAGRGKVLLAALSADASWSSWVGDPFFPLFLQEGCSWSLRPAPLEAWNLTCGQPISAGLDLARDSGRVELLAPGAAAPATLRAEGQQVRFTETTRTGLHRLELLPAAPGPARVELRAVNLDPAEGRLARIGSGELTRLYPAARFHWIPAAEVKTRARSGEEDQAWRVAAAALFAFLLLETLLGRRLARRGGTR